ncbi:DUF2294 domain-containing protein [Planomicrobium okeanokoites]|uniref:DUF2294 domain-containing protein n=1 Tax=Planomicrobium okeanokoites TaxID=244 RepID=UPI00360E7E39
MPKERTVQSETSGYISTLLRNHFGKGPTSVYVTIARPYITIHFRGFINPVEKTLLKQNEWKRVLETRDLLLNDLKPKILHELLQVTGLEFKELYADWNLSMESGLLLGIMDEKPKQSEFDWQNGLDKESFYQKLRRSMKKRNVNPDG